MAKILCATRGGEASYQAQDTAITLALEQDAELLFIFVVDTAFLNKTERAFRLDTVTREMDHMGEFLLMMALERAKKRGAKASLLIRHGNFRDELIEVGLDPNITTIVLGEPVGEESSFSLEGVKALRQEIEEATGTRVILVGISNNGESYSQEESMRYRPSIRAWFTNLNQPMPLPEKLSKLFSNLWRRVVLRQNCCGHPGEPGC